MKEERYQFRRRLNQVHRVGRRNPAVVAGKDEVCVGEGWRIVIGESAPPVVWNAARDLQDYLLDSMGVSVLLVPVAKVASAVTEKIPSIILASKEELPKWGRGLSVPRSYRLVCDPGLVVVCGCDARGAAQGGFYLEDLMNLREAPFVRRQDVARKPLFSPRMVHSGWGIDQFPDAHLNAMAHHGFDSILVFAKGPDRTTCGYLDFNELIDRADRFGLDVYFYSYLKNEKHPSDPDAEAYYDSTYGALFKACPRAKGVVLVGESVEFPSHDEKTTGRPHDAPHENGLPPAKPSPGWWPCRDYPQWLNRVKKAVRKQNSKADIVFWTYNWGWAPRKDRVALLNTLPTDITLLVTFEMFNPIPNGKAMNVCVDYTLSFEGPGQYFKSEAEVARRRGIRLYAMANTGGLTWDFGVVPYEPMPFQWARRHRALLKAREKWGLCGLMESHHFGWWPSFVSELAKWAYWEPGFSTEEIASAIARRDYGMTAAPLVLKAWQAWSEAIRHYTPTNEDQYGPFRVGPSYPLVFHPNFSRTFASKEVKIPSAWHAHFGSGIALGFYKPLENSQQSLAGCRLKGELRRLHQMSRLWRQGIGWLEKALKKTPSVKKDEGERLLNMGRFMLNMMTTTANVKKWWQLNQRLMLAPDRRRMNAILDAMEKVAVAEIRNAEETIPLVERDSRLGWEPSMEYMTDAEHLRWKVALVRTILTKEIPMCRKAGIE
ncbi:MAG: hypothetical protein PHV34_09795 [Verrucomicrobiae bacterium]|nr:hypothetical protein [Verrucomicrobiae bacterium]